MGFVKECTSETACSQSKELWLDFMTTHVDSYLPMKKNPELVEEMAAHEKNWQGTVVSYILAGIVLVNFVPELLLNIVVSPASQRVLKVVNK